MKKDSLIGKRLKEERNKLGLYQSDIAERCGVSREQWGKYERGENKPSSEKLFSFQKAGIDIDYVMHGFHADITRPSENLPEYTAEEAELLTLFRQSSELGRAVILSAARGAEKKADTIETGKVG